MCLYVYVQGKRDEGSEDDDSSDLAKKGKSQVKGKSKGKPASVSLSLTAVINHSASPL